MKLNKLEPKTTNNFNINDIDIEINVPENTVDGQYSITGDEYDLLDVLISKKKKISSKIGLTLDNYINVDIKVPKDIKLKEPVEFIFNFENEDILIDNFNIVYEENSSLDRCRYVGGEWI